MKKIALAAVLVGISSVASAKLFSTDNLYIQGDVGYSKLQAKDKEDGLNVKDNNPSFTIAVGKDTGAMRYALDYTYFGKIKQKEVVSATEYNSGELLAQSLGVSAIYDFQPVSGFTPYVGGRLGVNNLQVDSEEVDTATKHSKNVYTENKTKAGVGVLAGVQYAVSPQLAVDAGVEYNYLGKVEDIKFSQYGAKVGLRYSF